MKQTIRCLLLMLMLVTVTGGMVTADHYERMDYLDASNTGSSNPSVVWSGVTRGQTFTATETYDLYAVRLKFKRSGDPRGSITVGIRYTENGVPTENNLVFRTMQTDDVSGGTRWHWFYFNNPVYIQKGMKYCIVVQCSGTLGGNGVRWAYQQMRNSYPAGDAVVLYRGRDWSWTDNYGWEDHAFETYGVSYEGEKPDSMDEPDDIIDEPDDGIDDGGDEGENGVIDEIQQEIPGFELVVFIGAVMMCLLLFIRRKPV